MDMLRGVRHPSAFKNLNPHGAWMYDLENTITTSSVNLKRRLVFLAFTDQLCKAEGLCPPYDD